MDNITKDRRLFNRADVEKIRTAYKLGKSVTELTKEFKACHAIIREIIKGRYEPREE